MAVLGFALPSDSGEVSLLQIKTKFFFNTSYLENGFRFVKKFGFAMGSVVNKLFMYFFRNNNIAFHHLFFTSYNWHNSRKFTRSSENR